MRATKSSPETGFRPVAEMIVLSRFDPFGVRSTLPSTSRIQKQRRTPFKSRPYSLSRRLAKNPLQEVIFYVQKESQVMFGIPCRDHG